MADQTYTLGIDLGTTYTVVAHHGSALSFGPERTLLPSVLAVMPDGTRCVGDAARERRVIDPANTLLATKRLIGAGTHSQRAARYFEHHPYARADMNGLAAIKTRGGIIDPVEVAESILLEAVRSTGQAAADCSAVVTISSAFGADERQATIRAARRVGFGEVHLVEEPIATSVAYMAHSSLRYAAIYDLGGGTFDFAIVDCARYPLEVVANVGDGYLGGEDVDRELAQHVAEVVLRERHWDLTDNAEIFARLVAHCELAKIALSSSKETQILLDEVDAAGPWTESNKTFVLSRRVLDDITLRLVRRTFGICDEVLGNAGLRTGDIDAIFLAGGSVALPTLSHYVGQYFGKRPRSDQNPMLVVGRGASLLAARPDLAELLENAA